MTDWGSEPETPERIRLVRALEELIEAIEREARHAANAVRTAEVIRTELLAGSRVRVILEDTAGPTLPELITSMLRNLLDAGSEVRRAEAHALRAEGLSMDAIGDLFGVSRQRVATLLRADPAPPEES